MMIKKKAKSVISISIPGFCA